MSRLGHPKIIPYTKFEHFGIIRFIIIIICEFIRRTMSASRLSYAADKQTDSKILTPACNISTICLSAVLM